MPAILEAWRAGLFRRDSLMRNISAGVVVGIVALPLAMAFAIASGAKPEQGLYTALVAGLLVTLFGGTRVQIAGPTGAFAVLLFGVTARLRPRGAPDRDAAGRGDAAASRPGQARRRHPLHPGVRRSRLHGRHRDRHLRGPVGQLLRTARRRPVPRSSRSCRSLLASFAHLQPATTMLGVASLLIVALWPRIPVVGKVPSPMVALLAATAVRHLRPSRRRRRRSAPRSAASRAGCRRSRCRISRSPASRSCCSRRSRSRCSAPSSRCSRRPSPTACSARSTTPTRSSSDRASPTSAPGSSAGSPPPARSRAPRPASGTAATARSPESLTRRRSCSCWCCSRRSPTTSRSRRSPRSCSSSRST